MPKPAVVPVFAQDTNYPADAAPEASTPTKVAPSSTVEDVGYRPEGKPKAQNLNYVLYWLSAWAAYVDAGQWADDLHVTGTLTVDGATTINDDVHVTGSLDVDTNLNVDGSAVVDVDLSVGDDISATGTITTATDYGHTAEFTASLPVVITAASSDVGMSADVPYRVVSSGTTWWYYTPSFGAIGLRKGDRVKKIRVRFSGNTGTVNADCAHYRHDLGIAHTPVGATTTSVAANGHLEFVPTDATANTIELHDTMLDMMWVRVSGDVSGVTIEGIDVTWDHIV